MINDWTDSALKDHALRAHARRALAPSTCHRPAKAPSRLPILAALLAMAIAGYIFVSAMP